MRFATFFLSVWLCATVAMAEIPDETPESMQAMQRFSQLAQGKDLVALDKYLTAHPELVNRSYRYITEEPGFTILFLVAHHGQKQSIETLLSHGADPTIPCSSYDNMTPFTYAAQSGELDVVKEFIRLGVDIDHPNPASASRESGLPMSALDHACYKGRYKVVRTLLENKAKLDTNHEGKSYPALHYAMSGYAAALQFEKSSDECKVGSRDNSEVIDLLLEHGANLATYNYKGDQALHIAIQSDAEFTVKYLLEHHREKFDIDIPGQYGYTPLQLAATSAIPIEKRFKRPWGEQPAEMIVKLLLDHGADKTKVAPAKNGHPPRTPYDFAVENEADPEVLKLLKP
jgi:ankyrin repeat protein